MAIAKTISTLTTRFERTKNCPRSPWLWAAPTIFCLLVGLVLGVAQQDDPRWPAQEYLSSKNSRDGSYTISIVYDKQDKKLSAASPGGAPSLDDLTKKDGFRMFSVPRAAKSMPVSFKPYLEQHPGTVMLIQDRNGNVVEAQTIHNVQDVAQVIASLKR